MVAVQIIVARIVEPQTAGVIMKKNNSSNRGIKVLNPSNKHNKEIDLDSSLELVV